MTSAAVGFVNCKMIWKLAGVIRFVLFRAAGAVLLIHPCDHANGALRFEMQLLNQMHCFHCDRDTGGIIDRARSQVP